MGTGDTSDTPDFFSFIGRGSNSTVNIRFFPPPDEARAFRYSYINDAVAMSTDSDTPLIPERYQQVIEEGAKAKIYNWLGKFDRAQLHEAKFESFIKDMRKADLSNMLHTYTRAEPELVDSTGAIRGLRLPPEYGPGRF
jgi:hypothetical protein